LNRPRTAEEEEAAKLASKCIRECNVENLVTESKFLLVDSLKHLVDNLVSQLPILTTFSYISIFGGCLHIPDIGIFLL
jgi:hypothetical protein